MTPAEARDEVCALIKAAWASGSTAANGGTAAPIYWQNVSDGGDPPVDNCWARVTVVHLGGDQRTLGPTGGRRFERTGCVTVQVFEPVGEGVTRGLNLAKLALDSFEGKATDGGVWFRKCGIQHVGRTQDMAMNGRERMVAPDPWEQIQAVGEFTYDDIK